jgi:hypothetical protein
MKNWVVDYAVKHKDGRIVDHKTDFQADTIRDALDMAERMIAELREKDDDIENAAIWDIGIVEMDPF